MTLDDIKNGQEKYVQMLINKEKSKSTIRKYKLAIQNFIDFAELNGHCEVICKNCLIEYKDYLQLSYKPTTSNLYTVGINGYLHYLGDKDLSIKTLNIQNQNILENCFTTEEYWQMVNAAKNQKDNTVYYVIRTLANTGIRIRGLPSFTVETVKKGYFTITSNSNKRINSFILPPFS